MKNLELEWRLSRAEADRALSDGEVVFAFQKVWELITKYLTVFPEAVATHLNWLTSQIVRIREQGELPAEIEALRDEMLKWMPLLQELGMGVAPGFLPEGFVMPEFQIVQEKG